jgi:alanyl-tRNA synthetase
VRVVNRYLEQLAAAQRELKSLQAEALSFEAQQLSAQAEPIAMVCLVTKLYPNRSLSELGELAKRLPAQDNLVAVLAEYDRQKLTLVVGCADETGISAWELLAPYLAQIDGQGGDARLA